MRKRHPTYPKQGKPEPFRPKKAGSPGSASGHTVMKSERSTAYFLCAEVLHGLKPFAERELRQTFGKRIVVEPGDDPEAIFFHYTGDLKQMLALKISVAVYLVLTFDIPRPRALLGQQYYSLLTEKLSMVVNLYPEKTAKGFRISAPGQHTAVFTRIKEALAESLGIPHDPQDGDLFLRIRPISTEQQGWEVLIRLSPRPLSTRQWRVYNMEGALNATVAAAMIEITRPSQQDHFLNMMCGSGTLLIERAMRGKTAMLLGCDIDQSALAGAAKNIQASGYNNAIQCVQCDATRLPLADATFDVICVDLPWGQLVGSLDKNAEAYPKVLMEAARVAKDHARFVVITHSISLFEQILIDYQHIWITQEVIKIYQGGLHPRIYDLQRVVR